MILLTHLNGKTFFVNAEMIQFIDSTPDTMLTLIDKSKILVKETAEVVAQRFLTYRQKELAPGGINGSMVIV